MKLMTETYLQGEYKYYIFIEIYLKINVNFHQ